MKRESRAEPSGMPTVRGWEEETIIKETKEWPCAVASWKPRENNFSRTENVKFQMLLRGHVTWTVHLPCGDLWQSWQDTLNKVGETNILLGMGKRKD